MGLTAQKANEHVAHWEARLRQTYRSYRDKWPSRLFHHAPLENAIQILQSGHLLSRNDTRGLNVRDVAAQEVVNSRQAAHAYCRLYFRPRTPTQFHIEGIRRDEECYNGELQTHAPILIMFIFSARHVLSIPEVSFSTGNMQSFSTSYGDTGEQFDQIDFDKVYHEGGINGDHSIVTARCAEILTPSPLPLAGNLQFILCRSQAERQTLLQALGASAGDWEELVRVSDDIQVFRKEYCYVEEVSLSAGGVTFRLHPRAQEAPIMVKVEARKARGDTLAASFGPSALSAIPGGGKTRWIVEGESAIKPGAYSVKLWLEGHLAYNAVHTLQPKPF